MCIKSIYYNIFSDGTSDITEFINSCHPRYFCSRPEIQVFRCRSRVTRLKAYGASPGFESDRDTQSRYRRTDNKDHNIPTSDRQAPLRGHYGEDTMIESPPRHSLRYISADVPLGITCVIEKLRCSASLTDSRQNSDCNCHRREQRHRRHPGREITERRLAKTESLDIPWEQLQAKIAAQNQRIARRNPVTVPYNAFSHKEVLGDSKPSDHWLNSSQRRQEDYKKERSRPRVHFDEKIQVYFLDEQGTYNGIEHLK
jgi:hypothetical protein